MSDSWRLSVDRERCVGSAMCVAVAPGHFTLLDGKASAVEPEVHAADDVIEAWESCPVSAVLVLGMDGQQIEPEL